MSLSSLFTAFLLLPPSLLDSLCLVRPQRTLACSPLLNTGSCSASKWQAREDNREEQAGSSTA
eukprot:629516-Heterocapsa_arctica.AAC.1